MHLSSQLPPCPAECGTAAAGAAAEPSLLALESTLTETRGNRVPTPEYGQYSQVWYPDTAEYARYPGTLGVPAYLPEYCQYSQVWCPGTVEYARYPRIAQLHSSVAKGGSRRLMLAILGASGPKVIFHTLLTRISNR